MYKYLFYSSCIIFLAFACKQKTDVVSPDQVVESEIDHSAEAVKIATLETIEQHTLEAEEIENEIKSEKEKNEPLNQLKQSQEGSLHGSVPTVSTDVAKKQKIEKLDASAMQNIEAIKKENQANKAKEIKPAKVETPVGTHKDVVLVDNSSKPKVLTVPTKEEVQAKKTSEEKPATKPARFSHELFSDLLAKHVSATGVVDYAGFKKNEGKLDSYLNQLEQQKIETWNKDKQLAFWINAYNAYTIKLILNNYPLNSITDLEGGKPWDKNWIKLAGKSLSLNDIENKIIRPQFNEPRIHFAVNCAAKSCPPVLNSAWNESNLERNLTSQTRKFLNNASHNTLEAKKASISKIFEWYAEDFGDLISFINKYADTELNSDAKIEYKDYDWSLNGK